MVTIQLIEGPLPLPQANSDTYTESGAVLQFAGVVRQEESGRQLLALHYEAYQPMTELELEKLAQQILAEHQLHQIIVEHSIGRVAVGETSFRLTIVSAHRPEALAACGQFIDEMKRFVPLWKNPEYVD